MTIECLSSGHGWFVIRFGSSTFSWLAVLKDQLDSFPIHKIWVVLPRLIFFSDEPYSPSRANPKELNGDVGERTPSETCPLLDILGDGAVVVDPVTTVVPCGIGYQECESTVVATGRGAHDQGD